MKTLSLVFLFSLALSQSAFADSTYLTADATDSTCEASVADADSSFASSLSQAESDCTAKGGTYTVGDATYDPHCADQGGYFETNKYALFTCSK